MSRLVNPGVIRRRRPGLVFVLGPGMALPNGTTFARAGTAMQTRADGVRELAGSGVLRTSYWNGIPEIVLERAVTNDWTNSRSFGGAEWVKVGSDCPANAAFGTRSDGTGDAFRQRETAVTSEHYQERAHAATASRKQAWAGTFKAGERTTMRVTTIDRNAVVATSHINLANGALGNVAAAHTIRTELRRDGWYRVYLSFDSSAGAGPNCTVRWGPTTALNGALSYAGVGGWGINQDDLQYEQDQPWPSSEIETGAGAVTRVADDLWVPVKVERGAAYTIYLRQRSMWEQHAVQTGAALAELRTPTYDLNARTTRIQKSGGGANWLGAAPNLAGNTIAGAAAVPDDDEEIIMEVTGALTRHYRIRVWRNGLLDADGNEANITALSSEDFHRIHIARLSTGTGACMRLRRFAMAMGAGHGIPRMRARAG